MKRAAKLNFGRCSTAFLGAAAVLIVAGFIAGLPTYLGAAPSTQQLQNLMTKTSQTLSQGTSASTRDMNQLFNEWLSMYGGQKSAQTSAYVLLFTLLLTLGVTVLQVGISHMALIASAGGAPKFKDFFAPLKRFGRWLGLELWMGIRIYLWTLLFIVPGIIAAYRYRQAVYLMLEDPELGINRALKLSGDLMKGYKWRLLVLDLSFIIWYLAETIVSALFALNLLGLYLTPYYELTYVQFYYDLRREHPTDGLPVLAVAIDTPPVSPL